MCEKLEYMPPVIQLEIIDLEEGFAAGSAIVRPVDNNGHVTVEWETDSDESKTINW
ncbi:hypothetical protein [Sphingobacterium griseoflavum]|uniref:Uncharacterized protein n=1 Tax=Sphingobacterium griseoflavum TaxID=1474952 RepID=A0ABQ3I0U4_9SPHI|nr:hypothetical protein [Sphingobacterium griseoflavum]GHE39520.1 hypothetical protein GCM10017764_23450 [Sphingobacterium griseoflavum]